MFVNSYRKPRKQRTPRERIRDGIVMALAWEESKRSPEDRLIECETRVLFRLLGVQGALDRAKCLPYG
jgi:hypothetical protein